MSREYLILDNGTRPYRVVDSITAVSVYALVKDSTPTRYEQDAFLVINNPLYVFVPRGCYQIWRGKGCTGGRVCDTDKARLELPREPAYNGNTLLVQTSPSKYIMIGNRGVQSFTCADQIVDYQSPVGSSQVPYPYARTQTGAVITLIGGNDNVVIPASLAAEFPLDPYAIIWFDWRSKGGKEQTSEQKSTIKELPRIRFRGVDAKRL